MKQYINITFSIFLSLTLLTSCEDMFEVDPEEVLLSKDYLGDDEVEARSALFGVLSIMQELTTQYLVLGEMRADLVDVNANTTDEIRQIRNLDFNADNSYVNPAKLFSIINNCNYAIVGMDTKVKQGLLLEDYASMLRIRTWAQLQILINYGKLPYIDKPIRSDDDLAEDYPLLNFEEGLTQLIHNLRQIEGIPNVTRHDNAIMEIGIPHNDVLLGDLYLWRGEYIEAAIRYKMFLDSPTNLFGTVDVVEGVNYPLNSGLGIAVGLVGTEYTKLSEGWGKIFEGLYVSEIINVSLYDVDNRQPNSAYDIVTTQFKPSNSILLNWGEQFWGFNGLSVKIGDTRQEFSLSEENPEVIAKYNEEFFLSNRAAKVYLRYAEAINYAGYPEQALVVINGIFNNPDVTPGNAPIFTNPESYLNFSKDTYFTVSTLDVPMSGLLGIRGRVGMSPVSVDDTLSENEIITEVGKLILNEAALELAFEGNRWEDLVRFSRNTNDPTIIADAVANKLETAGDIAGATTARSKLLNQENWFLPLELPDNFVSE